MSLEETAKMMENINFASFKDKLHTSDKDQYILTKDYFNFKKVVQAKTEKLVKNSC